jgi:hypothetical protein
MDEFFDAHRNGKGKKHRRETTKQERRPSLDLNATLFHSSGALSFSIMDVFKAGVLWAEIGAGERRTESGKGDSTSGGGRSK